MYTSFLHENIITLWYSDTPNWKVYALTNYWVINQSFFVVIIT